MKMIAHKMHLYYKNLKQIYSQFEWYIAAGVPDDLDHLSNRKRSPPFKKWTKVSRVTDGV